MHFVCCTTRKNYGGVAILYNDENDEPVSKQPMADMEESKGDEESEQN